MPDQALARKSVKKIDSSKQRLVFGRLQALASVLEFVRFVSIALQQLAATQL